MTQTTSPQIRATAKELDIKLKTVDEDRWLATKYATKPQRAKLVAFYSLVHELERALTMSEPMIGRIRVQWWREVLDQIFSNAEVRSHDLSLALDDELGSQPALKPYLDKLLDSYDDVLDGIENEDKPPRMENGALTALCAACILDEDFQKYEEELANCGRAYISARIGSPCAKPRFELMQKTFADIQLKFGGAILYAATVPAYMTGKGISPLGRRWKVFKAVLSGKLDTV